MKDKTTKTNFTKTQSKESTTTKNKTEAAKEAIIKIIENATPADYVQVDTSWCDVTGPERRLIHRIQIEKEGNIFVSAKDRQNFSMFDNEDDDI